MNLLEDGSAVHRPVRTRVTHIDSLRGLALLGVIVMNIGSMVMMFNGRQVFGAATGVDMGIAAVDLLFVLGKARSCFACFAPSFRTYSTFGAKAESRR